uniref:Putative salivary lipocalin n=1 Tax=Ixodes ricinus TaxID=34613 RepID=A0A0K8R4P7_IXORI
MEGQLLTVCCMMVGIIILLPGVHSRATQANFDAARELHITKRFFMRYRSYQDDRSIREAAYCVSLLVTNPFVATEAILRYKRTPQSQYEQKLVRITTRPSTPQGPVRNMMSIIDPDTARVFYDLKLQYSDYGNCRVLVQQFQGRRECSLWLSPEKREGQIPPLCSSAYTDICGQRVYNNDDPARCR